MRGEDFTQNSMPIGNLRVLIDTEHRAVLALAESETHEMEAARALSISKDELNTFNAGHLVGAIITNAPGSEEYTGTLVNSSLDEHGVTHTRTIIKKAEAVLQDYLYRSPAVHECSVSVQLRAA